MTIAGLFSRRAPEPELRCIRCAGTRRLVTDDGPPVCLPCLYRDGRAAGFPCDLTDGQVALLQDAHGDAVRLVRTPGLRLAWRWVANWPTGGEVGLGISVDALLRQIGADL